MVIDWLIRHLRHSKERGHIRCAVRDMQAALYVVFTLARANNKPIPMCHVETKIRELIARYARTIQHPDVRVEASDCESTIVRAQPHLVGLLIASLIHNAVHTSVSGRVSVSIEGGGILSVVDSGRDFDASRSSVPGDNAHLYRRRAGTNNSRSNLGFYVAARICKHYGWLLQVGANAQGGTVLLVHMEPLASRFCRSESHQIMTAAQK